MGNNSVMILERSGQNLQKVSKSGKTVLEGIFAEFGVENRNGRIYEEAQYLKHLEYLKTDCANGNLLGELDHPERFEVSLNNVSHRVTDLWYDQAKRQVLGRIEILEGTPKGQTAKALLDAGVPLSISSRAAGTVREGPPGSWLVEPPRGQTRGYSPQNLLQPDGELVEAVEWFEGFGDGSNRAVAGIKVHRSVAGRLARAAKAGFQRVSPVIMPELEGVGDEAVAGHYLGDRVTVSTGLPGNEWRSHRGFLGELNIRSSPVHFASVL